MWSKNKAKMTPQERDHVGRIKEMPCICCALLGRAADGPSEAHELKQGSWFTAIPLDYQCHRGPNGIISNKKTYLSLLHMDEIDLLNETLRRLL
jgi:hypothetical protein